MKSQYPKLHKKRKKKIVLNLGKSKTPVKSPPKTQ